MDECVNLTVRAETANLEKVQTFIDLALEDNGCSMKAQMQIGVAVEEIFVNICHYAYGEDGGDATVSLRIGKGVAEIIFEDSGAAYDPLAKEDPDVTLSAEDRAIGGLGIYITKKTMDEVRYEYRDGKNILTLKKKI